MSRSLHILHLEDNPNDAELVRYALEAGGVSCVIEWVTDKSSFCAALDQLSFDIILADFSLPDYNGMAAFEEMQTRDLQIPFILITGALGEERSIECIKIGMSDYVLKTNLMRLSSVVPRAISEKNAEWQHGLALENLRLSEERFDLAVRGSGAGIWDWPNLQSNGMWWSPRVYEVLGYTEAELEPNIDQWKSLVLPEDESRFFDEISENLISHSTYDTEYRMMHKSGAIVWIRSRGRVHTNEQGEAVRMAGYIQDISDRKEAEAENRRLDEYYRAITHRVNEAIVVVDSSGKICFWNPAAKKIFGFNREEAMGVDLHQLLSPARYRDTANHGMAEYFQSGRGPVMGKTIEIFGLHKDGHEIPIELSLASIERNNEWYAVGVVRDISDRKRTEQEVLDLQKQLSQAQKMEAIGTLAGGIAHDFNNILAAIIGYSSLVQTRLPQNTREHQDMEKVLQAGGRAKSLVRQILTFARKTEVEKRPVAVDLVIKEVLQLLRASLPATIKIDTDLDAGSQMVLGSPVEVHQVVMNLCTNSFHAMEERGGVLEVTLKPVDLYRHRSKLADGHYLELTVTDSGKGISPQILERIFDPYFTTKEIDRGTGLGLSVVQGIIKGLGGMIDVKSELGQGSCFTVWFPCHVEEIIEEKPMVTLPAGGNEHIMYVDDEEGLAVLGQEFLEDLGYTVTPMFSSVEALATFRAEPEKYDLIVTDYTMPELTGINMAQEMAKISPATPVVLCSGFKMTLDSPGISESSICAVLLKPEVFDKLPQLLRQLFDGVSPG